MVSAQEISDEIYASISNSVIKHGSTVDVSVIINAFDILTNKVNHVNSVLQQRVDTWEACLTVDETDNNADKEYSDLEYFNLDVEQNMCPSILRKNSCGNKLITEEEARDSIGRISKKRQRQVKKPSLFNKNIYVCFLCYRAEAKFKCMSKKRKRSPMATKNGLKTYQTRRKEFSEQLISDVLTAGVLSAAKMKHEHDELKNKNSRLIKKMGYVKRTNNYLQENISKKRKQENISKKRHAAVIDINKAAHNSMKLLWQQTRQCIKKGGNLTKNARSISEVLKLLSELVVWGSGLSIRQVEKSLGMRHGNMTEESVSQTIHAAKEELIDVIGERCKRSEYKSIRDRSIIHNFMHDDKYTRLDNNGKLLRVKLYDGRIEWHKPRMSYKTLYELYKEDFLNSSYFLDYYAATGHSISYTTFKTGLDGCFMRPRANSCVDPIKQSAIMALNALYDFERMAEVINCCGLNGVNCDTCSNENYQRLAQGEGLHALHAMLCPKMRFEGLEATRNDDNGIAIPDITTGEQRHYRKKCCFGGNAKCNSGCKLNHQPDDKNTELNQTQCAECGFNSFEFCVKKQRLNIKVTVNMYKTITRENKWQEEEMKPVTMTVKQLFKHVKDKCSCYLPHMWNERWDKMNEEKLWTLIKLGMIFVKVDFASVAEIYAHNGLCCATPNSSNIEVFTIYYHPTVYHCNTSKKKKIRFKSMVVYGVAATTKHGRDANAHLHNTIFDKVVEIMKEYHASVGSTLDFIFIKTDNCPGQYAGRKNYYYIAAFYQKHKVRLIHWFPPKNCFKGVHDALGFTIKRLTKDYIIRNCGNQAALWQAINYSFQYAFCMADIKQYQKEGVLKNRKRYTIDEKRVYYVAHNAANRKAAEADAGGKFKDLILDLNRPFDCKHIPGSRGYRIWVGGESEDVQQPVDVYTMQWTCFCNGCWPVLIKDNCQNHMNNENCMYKDIVGESFKRHTMYKISGHGFGNQIAAIAKAKQDHMDSLVVGDLAISGRDANAAVISFGGSHYINYDLLYITKAPYILPRRTRDFKKGTIVLQGKWCNFVEYDKKKGLQFQILDEYVTVRLEDICFTSQRIETDTRIKHKKFYISTERHDYCCEYDGINDR